MELPRRPLLIGIVSVVALILIVILAIPFFLNAESLRTRIESALTSSLGRKVTLGKLSLSVFSGNLVADNASLADNPAFSTAPFLEASRVKIGIEMIPLIFSREIHITGFAIESPKITLLRASDGTWNYSTIGHAQQNASANSGSSSMIPNLTVGHISITNGQVTVGIQPNAGGTESLHRTYDHVSLEAKDFSFQKSFPFTLSAQLPSGGSLSLSGNAGPINQQDASLTPFTAHLEIKHLDPLAAGFVDAKANLTGLINAIDLQADWNGQRLHVTNLLVDTPKITLVRENVPKSAEPPTAPSNSNMLSTFTADKLQIKDGTLTISSPGQSVPAVYQQMNAEITNITPTASSPFKLSAQISGGGSATADGSVGPINWNDANATPLNTHVVINHLDLASSGVVGADTGVSGIANADVKALSDGKTLNANVSANIQSLRVAKNGSPSSKPVDVQLSIAQDVHALTGQVQKAGITIGRAVTNLTGTYQASGASTAINLKINGQAMPIDEIEAFLPSVGVHLPTGSRLQGGTLTTTLSITGSTASPVISGPIRLDNTNLSGFDLGSKLSAVTALTGAKTGSVTAIRSLSADLYINNGNVRTDNVSLVVPALGSASGAGTISAAGALNYNVVLKPTALTGGSGATASVGGIAGQLLGALGNSGAAGAVSNYAGAALKNGIPVAIGGTTSNPTFTPDMNGLLRGATTSSAPGSSKPKPSTSNSDAITKALGGLLGH
jgi:AsmA protein